MMDRGGGNTIMASENRILENQNVIVIKYGISESG